VRLGTTIVAPNSINICLFKEAGAWKCALSVARACDAVAKVVVLAVFEWISH
jgi:hypothetical protein